MTEKNLVSIIIPTFNRADLLVETLDSIIEQTYKNWECLVIDDGSTDHTDDIISHYSTIDPRIVYHKRPSNYASGGNGARNYGLDLAKGEYINWFDSDDIMRPNFLNEHLSLLINSASSFSVCKCNQFSTNQSEAKDFVINEIKSNNPLLDYISDKIKVMTPSSVFKTEFIKSNAYRFNEKLKAAQEWEFYIRVFADFDQYETIDKQLVSLRQHPDGMSYNSKILYDRTYNYICARKIVKSFLERKGKYSSNIDIIFQDFGKKYIPILIMGKKYKLLNKAIFTGGFTRSNLVSFLSIYFLTITKRNKSKTRYI